MLNVEPLVGPMVVLGSTYAIDGVLAILAINRTRPGELTGIWLAIAGIAMSVAVLPAAYVVEFLKRF